MRQMRLCKFGNHSEECGRFRIRPLGFKNIVCDYANEENMQMSIRSRHFFQATGAIRGKVSIHCETRGGGGGFRGNSPPRDF